jgi:hypothetical protein
MHWIDLPVLSMIGVTAIVGLICLTIWLWTGKP